MQYLYCPECGEYLEDGNGDMADCHCGFKQSQTDDPDTVIDCI